MKKKTTEVLWLKFWVDMFDNSKIRRLRKLPNAVGDSYLAIWFEILSLAGKVNEHGFLFYIQRDKLIPYDIDLLSFELDREKMLVDGAINYFIDNGMVDIVDNCFLIANWQEYQSADKLAEIKINKK